MRTRLLASTLGLLLGASLVAAMPSQPAAADELPTAVSAVGLAAPGSVAAAPAATPLPAATLPAHSASTEVTTTGLRTFYVDADAGSDTNSGLSPDEAWSSLAKVNATDLAPGDRVLLKAGDRWSGNIIVNDSGTAEAPIIIGSYGAGARPRVDGSFASDAELAATVLVHNAEYVQIRDLEVTNDADDSEGLRNGVLIAIDRPAQPVYSGYVVDDLYVHDVAGRLVSVGDGNDGKRSGGIGFLVDGYKIADKNWAIARLDGVTITDNVIERVDQTGIWLDSNLRDKSIHPGSDDKSIRGYGWDQIKWTGVDVGWNRIYDTGKNGAILRMADGGSFHHNEVAYTSDRVDVGNSVFTASVNEFVVEWNEVHHNLGHGSADGSAFDADLDSPGTVWRNNYSHDNNYGLMTLDTRASDDNIRVEQNIDIGGKGRLLNINYGFKGVSFTRNAFWAKPVAAVEYPDTHADYVNPDRAAVGGYPQLIWETHERTETDFLGEQTYTFSGNTIYNQAETATFYLNNNDATSRRTTNRTYIDNTFYGVWPTDGTGGQIADGFGQGGPEPGANWIADTVGKDVYNFWAPSVAGRQNLAVGPRGFITPENLTGTDRFFPMTADGIRLDRVKARYVVPATGEVFFQTGDRLIPSVLVEQGAEVRAVALTAAQVAASPAVAWKSSDQRKLEAVFAYYAGLGT